MWIRMLSSRRGSEDGHIVRCYEDGMRYDIADTLARYFIRQGWAYNDEPIEGDKDNG